MFHKPGGTIQGIWFHNGPEREQMAILLQKIVKSLAIDPRCRRCRHSTIVSTYDWCFFSW